MRKQEDIQQHIYDLERQLDESAYAKADGTDVQRAWHYLKTCPYRSVYLALEETRPLFEEFTQSYPSLKEPYSYFVEQYQEFAVSAAKYEQLQDSVSARENKLSQEKEEINKLAAQWKLLNLTISQLRAKYDEHPEWGTIDCGSPEIRELRGVNTKIASLKAQIQNEESFLEKEKNKLSLYLNKRNLFNKYQPLYDCLYSHFRQLDPLIDPNHEDDIEHADSYWRYSSFFQEKMRVYQLHYRLIKETQDALNAHLQRARQALKIEKAKEALEAFERGTEGSNELTHSSTVFDEDSSLHHSTRGGAAVTDDEKGLDSPVLPDTDTDSGSLTTRSAALLAQEWVDQKEKEASKNRVGFLNVGTLRNCAFSASSERFASTQPAFVR